MLMRLARHIVDVVQNKTDVSIMRSGHWRSVELKHLELQPSCAVCGRTDAVQVHHCFPFHYAVKLGRPDLELDQRNLITLCETNSKIKTDDHHLLIGHLDDFKSSNLNVKQDAKTTFHNMKDNEIRLNKKWLADVVNKLKPLNKMTDQDKKDFTELMNKTFPKIS
jgi:5-methylcytosine-specific restriction protein A